MELSRCSSIMKRSMILNRVLDSRSFSSAAIEICKEKLSVAEDVLNFNTILVHDLRAFMTGSFAEGMSELASWCDYATDIDWMLAFNKIKVSENMNELSDTSFFNLLIHTANIKCGYALLESIDTDENRNSFLHSNFGENNRLIATIDDKFYLASSQFQTHFYDVMDFDMMRITFKQFSNSHDCFNISNYCTQGPSCAVNLSDCQIGIDGGQNIDNFDFVPCVISMNWPSIAENWILRRPERNWPDSLLVQSIIKKGSHLVPISFSGSSTENFEWRFSFSVAERELIWSFNDIQTKCYAVLKSIKHHVFNQLDYGKLSSYVFKTAMFWTFENINDDIWLQEKLYYYIEQCLNWILRCSERNFFPNYFIPDSDILHGKVSSTDMRKIYHITKDLIDNLWERLQHIPPFIIEEEDDLNKANDFTQMLRRSGLESKRSIEGTISICVMETLLLVKDVNNTFELACELIEVLHKIKTIHFECKMLKSGIERLLKCKIFTLVTSYGRHNTMKNKVKYVIIKLLANLNLNIENLNVHEHVQIAYMYFVCGDTNTAYAILNNVTSSLRARKYWRFGYPKLESVQMFEYFERIENASPEEYVELVKPISDIIFHKLEQRFLPRELQIEFACSFNENQSSLDVFSIDPMVVATYLQFVCSWKAKDACGQETAMENIVRAAFVPSILKRHMQIALNLLANCCFEHGDIESALKVYTCAMKICEQQRATVWHVALMLNKDFLRSNKVSSTSS